MVEVLTCSVEDPVDTFGGGLLCVVLEVGVWKVIAPNVHGQLDGARAHASVVFVPKGARTSRWQPHGQV